ncbi:hypothetical protein GXW84_36860 [Rhodococcus sp. IEGM 248]|uniref:COG4315 family predicted lipoprotein n=1 Tax=unclassified Rhodococcus (in: high G+C Gram-positive bacteria) TaxID=192944 RepID=UPI00077A80A6|nr:MULTISPECIES: hypothetical protein [unclassified Rhodococcus (in: high G+C Gram-positive bacteria)]KXX63269.1 hypothetical protein AZG88_00040 [Rhodococcus sp. LB1]NDV09945.1 hypothetical protein [Rhodococcus sp. IEGM 248]PBC53410.1 hypothetical protein CJ177_30330 [Rhodococcus sp. ACPA1]
MLKKSILAAAGAGTAIALISACGTATDDAPPQVPPSASAAANPEPATPAAAGQVELGTRDTALGTVLTDGDGLTLYRFDEDTPGSIRCTGPCAEIWPPSLSAPRPDATLAARTGATTRPDGTEQITYDGHPLYRFAKDTAPGQTGGDGVKGTWHVVTVDSAHG